MLVGGVQDVCDTGLTQYELYTCAEAARINPRTAADRLLRACPVRPHATTRPRVRVSVTPPQALEFVRGDGACVYDLYGTERDRHCVQTYRHRISVMEDRPSLFAH